MIHSLLPLELRAKCWDRLSLAHRIQSLKKVCCIDAKTPFPHILLSCCTSNTDWRQCHIFSLLGTDIQINNTKYWMFISCPCSSWLHKSLSCQDERIQMFPTPCPMYSVLKWSLSLCFFYHLLALTKESDPKDHPQPSPLVSHLSSFIIIHVLKIPLGHRKLSDCI